MRNLKLFYRGIMTFGEYLQSTFLLIVRLFWGYNFFQAGWGKLQDVSRVTPFFEQLGIPFPELSVYLTGLTESICGLLLLFGLASRLAAIPLIIVMVVAYLTAHIDSVTNILSDPDNFIKQDPFTYLLASLLVFIFGPGKISLDYIIGRWFKEKMD